jgi:hypothetical protein
MILVFLLVVAVVLWVARFNGPVLAAELQPSLAGAGVLAPTFAARALPSRRQAELVACAAGLGFGGWIPTFFSFVSFPSYLGGSSNVAAQHARFERHLQVTTVYGLAVVVPALLLLAIANWRWRRATPQPVQPRRSWWFRRGWASPILGDSYRALGRVAALKVIALGASAAWVAWAVAYHYGA